MEKNAEFLTIFDLFKEVLSFFLGVAIVSSRIIKCPTVCKKLEDFIIKYHGFFIQFNKNE